MPFQTSSVGAISDKPSAKPDRWFDRKREWSLFKTPWSSSPEWLPSSSRGSPRRDTSSQRAKPFHLQRFEKTFMRLHFFGPFSTTKPHQDIIALPAALAPLLHDCLVLAYRERLLHGPSHMNIYKKVIKTVVTLLPQFRCYIQKINYENQNTENYHFFHKFWKDLFHSI